MRLAPRRWSSRGRHNNTPDARAGFARQARSASRPEGYARARSCRTRRRRHGRMLRSSSAPAAPSATKEAPPDRMRWGPVAAAEARLARDHRTSSPGNVRVAQNRRAFNPAGPAGEEQAQRCAAEPGTFTYRSGVVASPSEPLAVGTVAGDLGVILPVVGLRVYCDSSPLFSLVTYAECPSGASLRASGAVRCARSMLAS